MLPYKPSKHVESFNKAQNYKRKPVSTVSYLQLIGSAHNALEQYGEI